jgi:hypothetical protein
MAPGATPVLDTQTAAAPPPGDSAVARGGETASFSPLYIDDAIPRSELRLRFDAAYDDNRPDRAEFFYAKCGCFRAAGVRAAGPALLETSIDYQDISAYLEVAANERLSGFVEVPYRFLNAEQNKDTNGFSDSNAGFKYAFVADPDQFLTFQFRAYAPIGDAQRGLGNNHVSMEPALLAYQRLTDRLSLSGEFRLWVPMGGTDFEGNILRYGIGMSYLVLNRPNFRISPDLEFVGWTVLNGEELAVASVGVGPMQMRAVFQTQQAAGDTIVNAKVGVRLGFGELDQTGLLSRSDLAVSYGRALTGDVWYKDILRVEYRLRF